MSDYEREINVLRTKLEAAEREREAMREALQDIATDITSSRKELLKKVSRALPRDEPPAKEGL